MKHNIIQDIELETSRDILFLFFFLYDIISPFFQILGIFGLLVVIPLLNKYLKLHESLMMLIITSSTAVSILGSTLVKDLFPGFYLVRAIGFLRPSTLAVARSLLAMTVDNVQEIGRIYAITGFISAILPFVSNPSYR